MDGQCVFHGIAAKVFGDNCYANLLRAKVNEYIFHNIDKYYQYFTCCGGENNKQKIENAKRHLKDDNGHIKCFADYFDILAAANYLQTVIQLKKSIT